LDEHSVDAHRSDVLEEGEIVAETRPGHVKDDAFRIPMAEISLKHSGEKTMANVVGLGATFALTDHPLDELYALLRERFSSKGARVVKQNLDCCRAGAEYVHQHFEGACGCAIPVNPDRTRRLAMTGNQAIALGALASGLRFYAGYPMSPSTPIMEYLASRQAEFHLVMEQTEDEIAAVNAVIGASFAGVRAMTATSGGGFSLMVEGLGLAAMAEIPIVIVVAMRPGPATGFPTRTEQAELLCAIHASQDEFPRFVFAPGTADEAFYMTIQAFELAHRFQVPAILLSDQLLSDSLWTVPALKVGRSAPGEDFPDREWRSRPPYSYRRYAPTASGVSPRLRPGFPKQVVRSLGAEHTEEGFQTEDAGVRTAMHEKRMRKYQGMAATLDELTCFPGEEDSTAVVCFGSTFGAAREAVSILRRDRMSVGLVHLSQLAPFPRERVMAHLAGADRVVTVEMNSTAQLAALIQRETRLKVHGSVLKYDGRPFIGASLAEELRERCRVETRSPKHE
jgi:2-oxoglutarate ferredoxin oxidoreductase subunit alpha